MTLGGRIAASVNGDSNPSVSSSDKKHKVVVIGNGMVGQRFLENMIKLDPSKERVCLTTFCEEPRAAYNRVKLTSYFETRNPNDLSMTEEFDASGSTPWYANNNVEIHLGDKATSIDTANKVVRSQKGVAVQYDTLVLATGSVPFVPPIPGKQRPGVFVYRTIEDLESMLEYARTQGVKRAAVIGGGLLGLEAAKAVHDMGLESHIIEFADILLCRQIDPDGHNVLVKKIEDMGLQVHCGARTEAIVGLDGSTDHDSTSPVSALRFSNEGWDDLPVEMVVVSAGIKPRDNLARSAGIPVGERGGVIVDNFMRTPDVPDVYAIGEIALYNNFIYGLIAPGYTMANVAAQRLAHDLGLLEIDATPIPEFTGADMSTKLKLLGCDVASFGLNQPRPDDPDVSYLTWNDPISGIYRKLVLNKAGTKVRGGILVGDAGDYDRLHKLSQSESEIEAFSAASLLPPPSALVGLAGAGGGAQDEAVSDDPNAQICSCNDVTRATIAAAIQELGVDGATLPAVKKCTKAGTGCGGCEPQVKQILKSELEKLGGSLSNHLCEHFSYSRQELMALVRTTPDVTDVDSFEKIIKKFGHGDGCEICKPAVASILASVVNGVILEDGREALQDTNDRSLANMQRGGSYSVVPRVPGGELTPAQLIALGETAQKYKLYTKITGGQRVDLFGAAKHELPDIWEELGKAGFESGHAYGKALRTVKSCVGSTWCRYGVQDSVSFAIEVENRYKGIRAPHKM
jgi:nitrite reductase (NADH) large subunit